MGENSSGVVLESKCPQLLLLLAMRLHNFDRCNLAVVPIRAFWSLQMPRSTKIGLCVMMSMTMLSAIVTIIKGTYLNLFTDTMDPRENFLVLELWDANHL